ncbi:MAG: TRAM domain-containing protein [Vicinamibacteria bacterium]|nr:TRAM domain-containing protein [Vicinamibacteria bacterium]
MLAGFGRFLVLAILVLGGALLGPSSLEGALGGAVAGAAILLLEALAGKTAPRRVLSASFGLLIGLTLAALAGIALAPMESATGTIVRLGLAVGLGWIGLATGARRSDFFSLSRLRSDWEAQADSVGVVSTPKILDTSVIIDGRIAEIAEAGFMEGPLVIPQFVLVELQQVADSSDPLKRNRGRRGLDMLQRIQKNPVVPIQIVDTDFPDVKEVDLKLIELALRTEGKIVTNDFNLNKVAQLRGVKILNINDLANCLRPLVLPGEPMRIFVSKEGKEHGQGVGYLDDGTMVVVEGGRKALGRTIDVNVTTVLQTAAGKMIFVRWPEAPADDLTRKDTRPTMRRVDGKTNGNGNADAQPASLRDTEEVPLASRQTAEQLPVVGNGTTNRGQ